MDWKHFESELEILSCQIDYVPDVIVGVVRGGVVPARLLVSRLGVHDMYCVSVEKEGGERKVKSEIMSDLLNKSVLLVEDMLETGRSLIVAKKYLEGKGACVKTACLYVLPQAEFVPDFFLRRTKEVVRFPWELGI